MSTPSRWAGRLDAAVRSLKTSVRNGRASADVLRRECPTVYHQIRRSARSDALIELWGMSSNVDELAKGEIVAAPILRMIGVLANLALEADRFHAGYLHTYGYLFSTLQTPYGLKRDRWIRPALDQRFGFSEATIRVHPRQGTLLMNLTWLLGSLVFDRKSAARALLASFQDQVPDAVVRFARRRIRRDRIVERPSKTRVEIITDLFALRGGDLLVYSMRDRDTEMHRLFTAFPTTEDFRAALLDPHRFGPGKRDLMLRFNAVIPDLPPDKLRGERALVQSDSRK